MTSITSTNDILKEFDRSAQMYIEFAEKLRTLTDEILMDCRLRVHSVTARAKTRESLEKKLSRTEGKYDVLSDVTDLVGIRIITFFEDDVDRVAQAIQDEFTIDAEHSVDKRDLLDPDRFGYLSLHYVVSLLPARSVLAEYRRYADLKAEIQVRSILQHAWAEIEHDLGYKTALGVPRDVRRSFSRLAGLLELADKEFVSIRETIEEYEKALPARLERAPETVLLDKASFKAFIGSSSVLKDLDRKLGELCGGAALTPIPEGAPIEYTLASLHFLGLQSVAQLEEALRKRETMILRFAAEWLNGSKKTLGEGVSLLYLAYVLLGEGGDVNRVQQFLRLAYIDVSEEPSKIALRIIDTFKRLHKK